MGQPVGRKGLVAILETGLLLAHATWIAAEIPQAPKGPRNWSGKPGFWHSGAKNAHMSFFFRPIAVFIFSL
jgi:hypothetical protein